MKFTIEITQTRRNVVEVEANDETEALGKAAELFTDGKVPQGEATLVGLTLKV